MRFYDLQTTAASPSDGSISTPSGIMAASGTSVGVKRSWTSFPNGSFDPGALDVVFDLQIAPGHVPSGATVISVHGVDMADLLQAQDFRGSSLSLTAGMQGGLPLSAAQPAPGLLINATVFGAFGNWQGTEQTLDLLVIPSVYTQDAPGNLVFNWQPGQAFEDAVKSALKPAFPASKLTVKVNPALTTDQPILHRARTANGLAHHLHQLTQGTSALGTNYPGVSLYFNGSEITVTDFSAGTGSTIALKFNDLIGQPTWLEPPTLTINTILRADVKIGSLITLPVGDVAGPGSVTTLPTTSGSVFNNKLNFSGTFVVTAIRAVGQFRGTNADAWASVIQAVPQKIYAAG